MPATKAPKPLPAQTDLFPLAAPLAAELTAAEMHAVARVAKQAADVRDQVPVGETPIDVTIRLTGLLKVGADQPGDTITKTAGAKNLLGILFATAAPATRKKMIAALMQRYEAWVTGSAADEPELDLIEQSFATELFTHFSRQVPSAEKRGNVTGAIACELLERGPCAGAAAKAA